ncbi:transporter [Arenicella chitinivorans]|uniref:Transporter n=2 Tax=Arenicella chitinivorans TaxID=1329800 RepID=A0A918RGS2_9GAMM|nr:transporter [Arenicella chitinivorans]
MMAVNRYRIKTLADQGNRSAKLVLNLLSSPDRLLGTILFGNNVANIAASTLATVVGLRLFGDVGLAYAPMILVFVVLIFAEVAPKTLAAVNPERIAYPAAWVLAGLQILLSPFVWSVKIFSNGLLNLLGVHVTAQTNALNSEELRAAVYESSEKIDVSHQEMLLRILEMEKVTVEDVMIPRADMEAIDLEDDWDDIVEQLATSHHTRVPVFQGSMDNMIGIAHIRKMFYLTHMAEFNRETMLSMIREPYFIPENTSVTHALTNLQEQRRRFGIVVDEYGDIKGLVTLEMILEEVVGDFTTVVPGMDDDITGEPDGSFLVRGSTYLRDINRQLDWQLPTDTVKTVNGLITEYLEDIPVASTCFKLGDYTVEIVQTRDTSVHVARLKRLNTTILAGEE